MKVDIRTMERLLRGKCLPAEYLVRQFDALHERVGAAERERDELRECLAVMDGRLSASRALKQLWKNRAGDAEEEIARRDAAAGEAVEHPDDLHFDIFSACCKEKLAIARRKGRGGWDDPEICSVEHLADLLVHHLTKGNEGTFEDIANFAMMLHQRSADPAVLVSAVLSLRFTKGEKEAVERALNGRTTAAPPAVLPPDVIDKAKHIASVLEMIGSFDADDIDSDTVDLRFEVDGIDTGSDASITEYATKGAEIIRWLVEGAQPQKPVILPAGREFEMFHTTACDEPIYVMFMRSDEVLAALDAANVPHKVKE